MPEFRQMGPSQVAAQIEERINREVAETLRRLLGEKHLYQSIDVDAHKAIGSLAKKVNPSRFEEQLLLHAQRFFARRWHVQDPSGQSVWQSISGGEQSVCIFTVPHIKTFCETC